jgi:hypothetical protein
MQQRKTSVPRARSTPKLAANSANKSSSTFRVDNTFSCDHSGNTGRSQVRHCYSYVQELGKLKQFTEFEASNQRRLLRRQIDHDDQKPDNYVPRYYSSVNNF